MPNNLSEKDCGIAHVILKEERQWKRRVRVAYARRQLNLAHHNAPDQVPIRMFILRAVNYDHVDRATFAAEKKANSLV